MHKEFIFTRLPIELRRTIYITYQKNLKIDDRLQLGLAPGRLNPPNRLVEALRSKHNAIEYCIDSPTDWSASIHGTDGVWWTGRGSGGNCVRCQHAAVSPRVPVRQSETRVANAVNG